MENSRDVAVLLHFYFSSWASYTIAFIGVPLNLIQLSWHSICKSNGEDNNGGAESDIEEILPLFILK